MATDIERSYDLWAAQYDNNVNATRDLEGKALRSTLSGIKFHNCLELGCGTGKNTQWLLEHASTVTSVDLSQEMLAIAKQKIISEKVQFILANILEPWDFVQNTYDLVSFSLVLEHIENLEAIFEKVARIISDGGFIYVGELHPFKQYSGSKARFQTDMGNEIVECYNHNISDFILAAQKVGFKLEELGEYFDNDDKKSIPRIMTLLFSAGKRNIT